VPRTSAPEGRAGYLRWRAEQQRRHARDLAEILVACGVDESVGERAGELLRKERLHDDHEVQVHEDALCLVFLQTQLEAMLQRLGRDRLVEVLVKTLTKMSPAAVALTAELPLSEAGAEALHEAVGSLA
jgi:hypothetical protein